MATEEFVFLPKPTNEASKHSSFTLYLLETLYYYYDLSLKLFFTLKDRKSVV